MLGLGWTAYLWVNPWSWPLKAWGHNRCQRMIKNLGKSFTFNGQVKIVIGQVIFKEGATPTNVTKHQKETKCLVGSQEIIFYWGFLQRFRSRKWGGGGPIIKTFEGRPLTAKNEYKPWVNYISFWEKQNLCSGPSLYLLCSKFCKRKIIYRKHRGSSM